MVSSQLIREFLRVLDERILARVDEELSAFATSLSWTVNELLEWPRFDWREQLNETFRDQNAKGREATSESRRSILDLVAEHYRRRGLGRLVRGLPEVQVDVGGFPDGFKVEVPLPPNVIDQPTLTPDEPVELRIVEVSELSNGDTRIDFEDGTVRYLLHGGASTGKLGWDGVWWLLLAKSGGVPTKGVLLSLPSMGRLLARNRGRSDRGCYTRGHGPTDSDRIAHGTSPVRAAMESPDRRPAQKTQTPGHQVRIYREAIKMAKSGQYDRIRLNRAYSTSTGTRTFPRRLPDVIARRKTGQFDVIEVPSKMDLRSRIASR